MKQPSRGLTRCDTVPTARASLYLPTRTTPRILVPHSSLSSLLTSNTPHTLLTSIATCLGVDHRLRSTGFLRDRFRPCGNSTCLTPPTHVRSALHPRNKKTIAVPTVGHLIQKRVSIALSSPRTFITAGYLEPFGTRLPALSSYFICGYALLTTFTPLGHFLEAPYRQSPHRAPSHRSSASRARQLRGTPYARTPQCRA